MLTAEQLGTYQRDGFAIARGELMADEVQALKVESSRLWDKAQADLDREGLYWRRHETLGRVPDRMDQVHTISASFAAIANDPRFNSLAASALAAPSALLKDKLIFKSPGTFGYGLHTDFAYWADLGLDAEQFVSLFIALDECDQTSGGIELFPGLQVRTLRPHPASPLDLDPASIEGVPACVPTLHPGDVLLFHSRMPHRSAPNRSMHARGAYNLSYVNARHAGLKAHLDPERVKSVYRSLAWENL